MDVRGAIKGQYHAALAMLRGAVMGCPKEMWKGGEYKKAYWEVAFHVLFYTHFYLSRDEKSFRPWKYTKPRKGKPFTRKEIMAYWKFCDRFVDGAVDAMDLEAKKCGFWWYPMSKLEHQIVNIRHVQHHAAMLSGRLRRAGLKGVDWAGKA